MAFNEVNFGIETSDVIGLTPAQRTAVEFQLVFSISNRGTQLYDNFRYPRFRCFYGYAQIMSGAFVISTVELVHINQEILHFRDEVFGLSETIGCYAKAIAAALDPSRTIVTNSVLTRQRITGVRFRLAPTVKANVTLTWEVGEAKCGGNIVEPQEQQGKPPSPNNSNSGANPRPPEQGGDNSDPSANDGNYDPSAGLPPPPKPTEPPAGLIGQWFDVYSGYNAGCAGTYPTRTYAIPGATQGDATPQAIRTGDSQCGNGAYNYRVFYQGVLQYDADSVITQTFLFVPSN